MLGALHRHEGTLNRNTLKAPDCSLAGSHGVGHVPKGRSKHARFTDCNLACRSCWSDAAGHDEREGCRRVLARPRAFALLFVVPELGNLNSFVVVEHLV